MPLQPGGVQPEPLPVELDGLTKVFGHTVALRDVSLTIEPGEVFGYLGPNGAGKTTTLRLLTGMLRPTTGTARVFGRDSWREPVAVHRRIGYVAGEGGLYPRLTGLQHVRYFGTLRGCDCEPHARALAERLDLDLHRPAAQLSRGNRQKLAVVLAWMSGPDLLVLDEPSSGLDPLVQQEFHALLREHTAAGRSVLLSSHVLGEVQRVAHRIGVLREGRLVAIEQLQALLEHSLHRVRATFTDSAAADAATALDLVDGVRELRVDGAVLSCAAPQRALDAVLKEVARHEVTDFECAEADLEETFLTYYGERVR